MDPLERIKEFVESNPVALFIKGTPQMPMCGFSSRTAEALKSCEREFAWCNVIDLNKLEKSINRKSGVLVKI